jgi:hypothetical protein
VTEVTVTEEIDNLIASLNDWRGPMLTRVRELIHEADPEMVEEWKYMGAPVWSHDGCVAVGGAFKTAIKLGFLYGASLPDPDNLFNDELGGNQRRAIKFYEGDTIDEDGLRGLIRAGVEFNQAKKSKRK